MNVLNLDNMISPHEVIGISKEDYEVNCIKDETINEAFIRMIEASGMSMAEFSRRSGLSELSIVRYRKHITEPSLESLVVHCITLKTNIFESLYLISKAGYSLLCSDDKKIYLLLIFMSRYCGVDVEKANEILKGMGMKPLTNKQKEG